VLAGFAAGLSVAVWALVSLGSTASGTPPQVRSLVVLPFENRSGDASQDYFAEGIGDGIAVRLAQVPGLRVINRNTARIYLASGKPKQAIGRELGVDVVLDGAVQHSGGDIAIDIELVRAATDDRLWSRAYRRPLTEILALERELSDDVARQFQLQGQHAAAAGAVPLVDPQAFEDYLQGQHYFALRTQESLPLSIRAYERSIARAPDFARSHAGLAHSYIVLPFLLAEYPRDVYALARAAAERAIELDASFSDAHLAMAEVRLYADWDWAGAEQSFRRALALNPGSATAHQWYAEFLAIVGRYDEAIREIDTTLLLNPLSAVAHHQAGNVYLQARQWEKSTELQDRALALDPRSGGAYGMKARALYFLGRDAEGVAAEQQACGLYWPDGSRRSLCDEISRALARGGRPALREAQRRLAETLPRPDYYLARFAATGGDHDAAISRLAVSIERRDPDVTWLLADPEFDALRSDPRFLHQVSRVGLAPGQRATR
jgi:TolB-like protein